MSRISETLIPSILLEAKHDPIFIRKLLLLRPHFIGYLDKSLKALSFDLICQQNLAGYVFAKVAMEKWEVPPLDTLRIACIYDNVEIFEAYHYFVPKFNQNYFEWEIKRSIGSLFMYGHYKTLQYLHKKYPWYFDQATINSGYLTLTEKGSNYIYSENTKSRNVQIVDFLKSRQFYPDDETNIQLIHGCCLWKSYLTVTEELLIVEFQWNLKPHTWNHIEFIWNKYAVTGGFNVQQIYIDTLKSSDLEGIQFLMEELEIDLPDISEYQDYLLCKSNINIVKYLRRQTDDGDLQDFLFEYCVN